LVTFFAWLCAALGLYLGHGDRSEATGEFFICPWHPDLEASLHVQWELAIFHCFGCERGGGVRELRVLVLDEGVQSPRKSPNDDLLPGDRGTYGGTESLRER